jgi:hypothetical protein
MDDEKCSKCPKKHVWIDYTGQKFCETHFLEIIEKRIRKNLRINKLIEPKKEYSLKIHPENKHELTEYFLKKIFEDRITLKKTKTQNKKQTIISNTLDDELENLLNFFMNKQELDAQKLKPLSVITDDEAITIAKILNIELKIKPKQQNELTKKDPQLLFSSKKSKDFVEKIIKK